MFNRRDLIYIYDGSFDGLLTAIFDSFKNHELPLAITNDSNIQEDLFCEYKCIKTDTAKAKRVSKSISEKVSHEALTDIYYTYLSDTKNKGRICLEYVHTAFRFGKNVKSHMTIECVFSVISSIKRVKNEAHQFIEFIRFEELDGGVFYSKISPRCDILEIVSKHFQKRFPTMPWLIHDLTHNKCAVYNGNSLYITPAHSAPKLSRTDDELKFRKYWKRFYDTIEIKERHNERCRSSHMPKRFWDNMTEFNEL